VTRDSEAGPGMSLPSESLLQFTSTNLFDSESDNDTVTVTTISLSEYPSLASDPGRGPSSQ
jgi:hypothetical protein